MHFVIHFLHISLSASIYSKVPKTNRAYCPYLSTNLCCEILCGGKEHCNKMCLYSGFFLQWGHTDPMVLLT